MHSPDAKMERFIITRNVTVKDAKGPNLPSRRLRRGRGVLGLASAAAFDGESKVGRNGFAAQRGRG
jgi:hypothetical protein